MTSFATLSNVYLDLESALERLGNNQEMLAMLLNHYKNEFNDVAEKIPHLLEHDKHEAQAFIHTIKGTAANLSLNSMAIACAQLEAQVKSGEAIDKQLMLSLKQVHENTLKAIDDYLA